ncbi:MAG: hypothetical protein GF350_09365 [Chitinivibrionales bacterium]|nr:hypothetical protein [Chitinivibrionales bacterium]
MKLFPKRWKYKPDYDNPPPPEEVFFIEYNDKDADWRKLFRFASYCKTWSEEEKRDKYYPINERGWDYLRVHLYSVLTEELIVILKVRQILATWGLAILFVWECMARPHRLCGFASKGLDEGKEFLRRCAYIYERLPESWKEQSPVRMNHGKLHTSKYIEWENDSRIKTYSSSGEGPRSDVLTRGGIDEANYIDACRAMMKSFMPALDGRPLVVQSTPKLVASDFEEVVDEARMGNRGVLLEFPVTCRPGRDEEWQANMERKLGKQGFRTEFGLEFAIREEHALFPTYNNEHHVISRKDIGRFYEETGYRPTMGNGTPESHACPIYCAFDTHVTKPSAVLWMAVLPDDTWYFIDELWYRGDVSQLARVVKARESRYRIVERVIDPSGNMAHTTGGMKPVSTQLREHGIYVRTAERHKIGIDKLQAKMEIGGDGRPRLYVHPRCEYLKKQFRSAGLDSERKAMAGGKFDFIDCAKYIANCRPQFDQYRYREEQKGATTEYSQMLRDLQDNFKNAQRGSRGGIKWRTSVLH